MVVKFFPCPMKYSQVVHSRIKELFSYIGHTRRDEKILATDTFKLQAHKRHGKLQADD